MNGNKDKKILNEIVEIFDRKAVRRLMVSPSPSTKKIVHVPARVEQLNYSPNTHTIKHTPAREPSGEQKPVKTKIPEPLTIFLHGTFICKSFDKKYCQATILGFDTRKGYYVVQYNDNDEEELTPEEVEAYLIPPEKGEYWTENQSGC